MAEKFPPTHTPPKTASEVERFYQEATGYDDENFRRGKRSSGDETPLEKAKILYKQIKNGDYEAYAATLSEQISSHVRRAGIGEVAENLRDPEFISKLNFIRQYSYNQSVNNNLTRIFFEIPDSLLKDL